jgi:hypothetical protein
MLHAGPAHSRHRVKVLSHNPQRARIGTLHKTEIAVRQWWYVRLLVFVRHGFNTFPGSTSKG